MDSTGDLYFSDSTNNVVRMVTKATGIITTVAGTGTAGYTGDGSAATGAELTGPSGVALDSAGNLYIADSGNNVVRMVTTAGIISTVAGTGTAGYTGDSSAATGAQLSAPVDVAVDGAGNLYIADSGNNVVRMVSPANPPNSPIISTVAGNGTSAYGGDGGSATSAELQGPSGVAADSYGNLYIADTGNARIREVIAVGTPNASISTVAGTGTAGNTGDGTAATGAELQGPIGVALDSAGNLYIADSDSNVVRMVNEAGIISTVAGDGTAGFSGDGGMATSAELNSPRGVAVDGAGNLYITDYSNYRIRLVPLVSPQDTSPPTITPTITGIQGNNGWYTTNVTINWTVTDPIAPVISQTGCSTTTINTDTSGQNLTCTAVGQGGTATNTVTVKRDATPPLATATASPMPNGNGWNDSTVTVSFAGTDSTSGIASCSASVQVTSQGASQTSPAGTCTDMAGNVSAGVSVSNINIDEAPPVSVGSASPSPNSNGWNNTPVTVTFTATDTLSGVAAAPCGAPVVVSMNGAGQTATATCSDKAGNQSVATFSGINIDSIAPVATTTATPQPNAAGWNNTAVTVSFSGTDNMFGSGIASCTASVTVSTQGANQVTSGTCSDKAGNVSASVSKSISIDETAPTVSLTTPANGADYPFGALVGAVYGCSDTGTAPSGVASCTGTVANGAAINTAAAGSYSFAVTAVDVAGNTSSTSVNYTVSAAVPGFVLLPNPLAFPSEQVSIASAPLPITLTSTGTATLAISSIGISGTNANQFSQTNNCGVSVVAGGACEINVVFTPTSSGAKSATLKVVGGAAGTKTVTLTGSGFNPTVSLSPTALSFGSEPLNVPTASQAVLVTNPSATPLTLGAITLTSTPENQFTQTNNCTGSLAPGASCTVNVVFTPTAVGAKTAKLQVAVTGGGATQTTALSGTGIAPTYTLSPTALSFGTQTATVPSTAQSITVTNSGTIALPITSIALSGGNANQFSTTNNCGTSLTAGSTCSISVVFTPTGAGAKSSKIVLTAGGGAPATSTTLSGTGAVPTYSLSPASITFGNQLHGTSSATQSITLQNSGSIALPVSAIALTGTGASQFGVTNTCGTSVAAGVTCSISVTFSPTTTGKKSASVQVTVGDGGATQSVTLTGTGT